MVALSIPKIYTVDDLVALPNDNYRYELIRGELIQLPLRDYECSGLGIILASFASMFALESKRSTCTMAGTGFLIARNPDTVMASDWAFVRRERTFVKRVCGYLPLAPDIVLEVRSPSDSPREVALKVAQWLAAGTRIVWELNPKTKVLAVHREGETRLLGPNNTLDGGDVLPGFTFELRRLFLEAPAATNS